MFYGAESLIHACILTILIREGKCMITVAFSVCRGGTGARLLAYCLPLKKLYITGKGRTVKDMAAAGDPGDPRWNQSHSIRRDACLDNDQHCRIPQLITRTQGMNAIAIAGTEE